MNEKLTAISKKQERACRQTFVRANMPLWAVNKCMVTCLELIQQVGQSWQDKDKNAYENNLNRLTAYVNEASKRSWHSVPPPLVRRPGESVEEWIDRMYERW